MQGSGKMASTTGQGSRIFSIGMSGDVEYGLLPALVRRLRLEAPGVMLRIQRLEQQQLAEQLKSGAVSVGLCYGKAAPADAHCVFLRQMRLKLLRCDSASGEIGLDEYCRRPHAVVSGSSDVTSHIDHELNRLGRSRRVEISLSQFSSLPLLLAHSDLISTVPDYVAEAMVCGGGVRSQELPLQLAPVELTLRWDPSTDDRTDERWLRNRLKLLLSDSDD